MKTRKLNFAEMGRTLTRAEMKEIIAGYGNCSGMPGGFNILCACPNGDWCCAKSTSACLDRCYDGSCVTVGV